MKLKPRRRNLLKEFYWFNKDILETISINDSNNEIQIIKATENIELEIPSEMYSISDLLITLNNLVSEEVIFQLGTIVDERGRTKRCVTIADEAAVLSVGGSFFDYLEGVEYVKSQKDISQELDEGQGIAFKLHPKAREIAINRNPQWSFLGDVDDLGEVKEWRVYFKENDDEEEVFLGIRPYEDAEIIIEDYYLLPSHRKHLYSIIQKDEYGKNLVEKVKVAYSGETEKKVMDIAYNDVSYLGVSDDSNIIVILHNDDKKDQTEIIKIEDDISEELLLPYRVKRANLSDDGVTLAVQNFANNYELLKTSDMKRSVSTETKKLSKDLDVYFTEDNEFAYYQEDSKIKIANMNTMDSGYFYSGEIEGVVAKVLYNNEKTVFFTSDKNRIIVYNNSPIEKKQYINLREDVYRGFSSSEGKEPEIINMKISKDGRHIYFSVESYFGEYDENLNNYDEKEFPHVDMFIYELSEEDNLYIKKLEKIAPEHSYKYSSILDSGSKNYYALNREKLKFYNYDDVIVGQTEQEISANLFDIADHANQVFYIQEDKGKLGLYTRKLKD